MAPNRLLRIVVPLILILIGIGAATAVFVNSSKSASKQQTPTPALDRAGRGRISRSRRGERRSATD